MRPFTPGIGIVATSSSGGWAAAFAAPSARPTIRVFMNAPLFTLDCEGPGETEANFLHCLVADASRAHAGIEGQALARAPDGPEQQLIRTRRVGGALREALRDRPHRPGERSFEDGA